MEIVKCNIGDVDALAVMNKQLIEDEKHDNTMNVSQLAERMKDLLSGTYSAFYLTENGTVLGYALINTASSPVYLRHFFICREYRRRGYGRKFVHLLLEYFDTTAMDTDVLSWNKAAITFWNHMGFRPRSIYMRYKV